MRRTALSQITNNPNAHLAYGYDVAGGEYKLIDPTMQATAATRMADLCAWSEAELTATNDNGSKLATVITRLESLMGYVDGIEALITSLNAAVSTAAKQDLMLTALANLKTAIDTLTMAEQTAINSSVYTTPLSALANPTVKGSAGKIWGYQASGIVELRDNTVAKWTTVGATSVIFNVPIVCTTSIKLFSTLGSSIALQYT